MRCLDLASGEVLWIEGIDAPIRTSPWVLGKQGVINRPSGVEGAPDLEVEAFTGLAFARNRDGLFAFDLLDGHPALHSRRRSGARSACTDKYVLTMDGTRTVILRDREDGHEVKGTPRPPDVRPRAHERP